MNTRMDRSKLNIGTYVLQPYARTEEHIRDLAECGINLIFGMDYDRKTLDLLEKYHIGSVVSGIVPGWCGGTGENAGQMAARNPLEAYREKAKQFTDHPAVWGIDVGDEPSALDFPHYGRVMALVEDAFPNQFAYLNLYPSYGSLAYNPQKQAERELRTKNYEAYIQKYCTEIQTDYLSFDHYVYSSAPDRLIDDLRVAATACRRSGRGLWVVLQVNSHIPEIDLSLNRLRFQAYTAMAFGVECITWACYTAGWWHNQVLDEQGRKTPQYEKLKQVNREIKAMADSYRSYRWVKTTKTTHKSRVNWGDFVDFHAQEGAALLIGQMESIHKEPSKALFLCGIDDPQDRHPRAITVCFRLTECRKIVFHTGTGAQELFPDPTGWYHFEIQSCSGGLLTAE